MSTPKQLTKLHLPYFFVFISFFICLSNYLLLPTHLWALENAKDKFGVEIGVQNKLGNKVNLSLKFNNSAGEEVELGSFFKENQAVILVPGYFKCLRLCGEVFNGVSRLISELEFNLGGKYRVITVSFDESDNSELAKEKEKTLYNRLADEKRVLGGWKFLTGKEQAISELMSQIGFQYKKEGKDFAHGASIFVLTPEGILSQYFAGVQFDAFDVKLAILESAGGKIGNFVDQVLVYCFRFDPTKGKYTWFVIGSLRVVGLLTILLFGGLLIILWRREKIDKI